ncbi:MAG: preprotein translocase subunit SecE [Bacilli bacterium]|nr:preprotein translocase subunit SecE [Bacilli bacterium]
MKKITGFFKNVMKEMKNVRWPNKKEMALYSAATFACIIFFALFFTAIDLVISVVKMVLV